MQKIKQIFSKLRLYIKDHVQLLFKSAADNHLRIKQCEKDEKGNLQCTLVFSSFTSLKNYQKKVRRYTVGLGTATAMMVIAVLVFPLVYNPSRSGAANYSWVQGVWTGGADEVVGAQHPVNSSGWSKFFSKDEGVVVDVNGDVTLAKADNWSETLDADFSNNISKDATIGVSGDSLKLLKPDGASCTAAAECRSSYCIDNLCVLPPCDTVASGSFCLFGGITYGVVTGADGKLWLDRNLGATAVATAYNTQAAYGWLFQWGRRADGHQYTAWGGQPAPALSVSVAGPVSTTTVPAPDDVKFLTSAASPDDWLSPQNDTLWVGVSAVNNPCPTGFRLPTQPEWSAVVSASGITNSSTAASSALRLPAAGLRNKNGSLSNQGSLGLYWSSSPYLLRAYNLDVSSAGVNPAYFYYDRASGMSVRCLKN